MVVPPSPPVSAVQGTPTLLTIHAKDLSSLRSISVRIYSPPYFGDLSDGTSNLTTGSLVKGSLSPAQYQRGVGLNVTYTGDAYYFNTPTTTWRGARLNLPPENITVTAQSSDSSQSSPITYPISVQNVNDPTYFTFDQPNNKAFEIYAYSAVSSSASNTSISSTLVVSGFRLNDYDLGVDPVRVEITSTTTSARITLNRQFISLLDFSSLQYCFSLLRWQCSGNGYSASSMSFVAQPSDALAALNGLTYLNTQPNINDAVTVTIYDGEGGFCLDNSQQGTGSIRSGCFASSASFSVTVKGFSNVITDTASSNSVLSIGYVLYAIIGLGVILCILLSRCAYYGCRCRKPKTKKRSRQSGMFNSFWRARVSDDAYDVPPGYTVLQFDPDSSQAIDPSAMKAGTRAFRLDKDGLPRPLPVILLPQDLHGAFNKQNTVLNNESTNDRSSRVGTPTKLDEGRSDAVLDFIMGNGGRHSPQELEFQAAKRAKAERLNAKSLVQAPLPDNKTAGNKMMKPRLAVWKAGESFKPEPVLSRSANENAKLDRKIDQRADVNKAANESSTSLRITETVHVNPGINSSPNQVVKAAASSTDAYKANLAKFEAIRKELAEKKGAARKQRLVERGQLRPISALNSAKPAVSPTVQKVTQEEVQSRGASPASGAALEPARLRGPRGVLRTKGKKYEV